MVNGECGIVVDECDGSLKFDLTFFNKSGTFADTTFRRPKILDIILFNKSGRNNSYLILLNLYFACMLL